MPEPKRPAVTLEQLARFAYSEMVRRANELQERILADQRRIIEFGNNALPDYEFMRRSLWDRSVLTNWREEYNTHMQKYRNEHAWLIEQIDCLEKLFAENKERRDKAFAEGLADYLRGQMK